MRVRFREKERVRFRDKRKEPEARQERVEASRDRNNLNEVSFSEVIRVNREEERDVLFYQNFKIPKSLNG